MCLVNVLASRADWFVGQERLDEVAVPAGRAIRMVKTTHERTLACPAVAALADFDRHRGAGHAAAAEMAGAWAAQISHAGYRAWMLSQRGMCLARMGRGDEGAAVVARSSDALEGNAAFTEAERWINRTAAQCEVRLASGEPDKAATLVGGRRERHFLPWLYVRIEHANGHAVTDADMAHTRLGFHWWRSNPQGRRQLARIERRQAKLTGGEPVPFAPVPTDGETGDRLWAAVLREHRGQLRLRKRLVPR